MNFELVSLDGVKFRATAYSVVLPTATGQITLLKDHEPLLGVVVPGTITVRKEQNDPDYHLEHYATLGGVLEVTKQGARVLVDEAAGADEISEAEAEKAHQAALELRKNAKDQIELDHAQTMIDRHAVRLNVAKLRKRQRNRGQM